MEIEKTTENALLLLVNGTNREIVEVEANFGLAET
jgi:hypothetical protein